MSRAFSSALAAFAITLPALAAPAFAQEGGSASVAWIRGTLRGAIAPSSTWSDLNTDTSVKAGDTLKTVDASAAELLLPSGARVTLGANTIVRLQDLEGLTPRVMAGRVKLAAPPSGTAALAAGGFRMTGTDAEAVVERSGATWRVAVLAGSFRVVDASRPPMQVEAGHLLTFEGGQALLTSLTRSKVEDLQEGFQMDGQVAVQPSRSGGAVTTAGPSKWLATGLSAVLPGAGQLYNGDVGRGLGYLSVDFLLIGATFYGRLYGQPTLALGAGAGLIGLNLISPLDALLTTQENPQTP